MTNQTLKLYEYHVWANRRVFEHLHQLPEEVWSQQTTSVFPSVGALMSHIYAMDGMWLSVMQEAPFDEARALLMRLLEETKEVTLDELQERFERTAEDYRNFLASLDSNQAIAVAHPQYGSVQTPISELVQHVVNHGTYHRGNLTAMLRQCGHPGVPTDYMFYLYTV
ncbi:DinB family protein [Paenibacillus puldeungensis]|uniref:DinB family protein n=1 Tax=Paenibacillus puldeungensis TaxID=696536 RepID=A0ABW3RTY6_9BACL